MISWIYGNERWVRLVGLGWVLDIGGHIDKMRFGLNFEIILE